MALELGLPHPFAAAHAVRDGHPDAVAGRYLIIGSDPAGPVARGVPSLHVQAGAGPQVAVHVLLEDDVGSRDRRSDRTAAEVEDEHHVITGHCLLEVVAAIDQRLARRQFHLAVVEEGIDVIRTFRIVGELDRDGHVLVGEERDAEVVLLLAGGGDMALELGLAHPFAAAHAVRNGHGDAVAGRYLIIGSDPASPVARGVPGLDF